MNSEKWIINNWGLFAIETRKAWLIIIIVSIFKNESMVNLNDYNYYVGQSLLNCQRIEHDVKIIYAAILPGDLKNNLSNAAELTLADCIHGLKDLQKELNPPIFDQSDFNLLKDIKSMRNWLAHRCYVDFLYVGEDNLNARMQECFDKVKAFCDKTTTFCTVVEKARFFILKKFNRL